MSSFLEVGLVSDFRDGAMRKISAGGREILVARVGGRFFAADSRCPHLNADLSEGSLQGTILTCPMHHSRFDLTDGHVIRWTDLTGIKLAYASRTIPPKPLKIYPVKTDEEKILIAL